MWETKKIHFPIYLTCLLLFPPHNSAAHHALPLPRPRGSPARSTICWVPAPPPSAPPRSGGLSCDLDEGGSPKRSAGLALISASGQGLMGRLRCTTLHCWCARVLVRRAPSPSLTRGVGPLCSCSNLPGLRKARGRVAWAELCQQGHVSCEPAAPCCQLPSLVFWKRLREAEWPPELLHLHSGLLDC